jgi:hypothetical protein
MVEGWRDWPFGKLVLVGPEGAGKTHLAHVWAAESGAQDHRGAKRWTRPILWHATRGAWRWRMSTGWRATWRRRRGFSTCTTPGAAGGAGAAHGAGRLRNGAWTLPDLDSRMRQATLARIDAPDDALLSALLLKLSHDRGLKLTPAILAHVLPRIERSAAAVRPSSNGSTRGPGRQRAPRLADAKAALAEVDAPVSPSRHNP